MSGIQMVLSFYYYFARLLGEDPSFNQDLGFMFFLTPPAEGQRGTLKTTGQEVIVVAVNHCWMTLDLGLVQEICEVAI